MPPTTKENENLADRPESAAHSASAVAPAPDDHAAKAQPVALELPVTVNGARTVEGSDKREPFSESTKTVLVFGNGAVIRLSSTVAPGQLLFLTNEKTKREVVCQVVKSKNYRNVSGYVELEFTEQLVGFWGMRFPTDRIAPAPQSLAVASKVDAPAPSAIPNMAQTNPLIPVHPVRNSELRLSESKFVAAAVSAKEVPTTPRADSTLVQKPVAPVTPIAPLAPATLASLASEIAVTPSPVKSPPLRPAAFDSPRTSDTQASIFAPPPQAPAASPSVNVTSLSSDSHLKDPNSAVFASENLPPGSELRPVPPPPLRTPQAPVPHSPVANVPESETLKRQSARLQEQLSNMLFTDTTPAKPTQQPPATPVTKIPAPASAASKVIELPFIEPQPQAVKPVGMPKSAPAPEKTLLDKEELKIPAWLEPLARNSSAAASTQELIDREKSKRLAEQLPKVESFLEEYAAPAEEVEQEQGQEAAAPTFASFQALGEDESSGEDSPKTFSRGPLMGAIAATVLLVAGGAWWFTRPQASGIQANATAAKAPAQAPAPTPVAGTPGEALQPQSPMNTPAQKNSAVPIPQSNPAQNPAAMAPLNGAAAVIRNASERSALNSSNSKSAAVPAVAVQPTEAPLQTQLKKPSLGEVRLSTPTVTRRGNSQDNGVADPGIGISGNQPDSNSVALGAGLGTNPKQPAGPAAAEAPLAVGGDVKAAKMISSVHPVYPMLAKNQHVSGNVLVDALIDPTGRVTTMKILSGPTLLHQAALDAVKQWKYQPATLDGKPVAMHLTVTVQFRLQ